MKLHALVAFIGYHFEWNTMWKDTNIVALHHWFNENVNKPRSKKQTTEMNLSCNRQSMLDKKEKNNNNNIDKHFIVTTSTEITLSVNENANEKHLNPYFCYVSTLLFSKHSILFEMESKSFVFTSAMQTERGQYVSDGKRWHKIRSKHRMEPNTKMH